MIGIVTRHWQYKVTSVALAGMLWLLLVEEQELVTSVQAPIQYRNAPKDLELSSDVPDKVHLEVRGPASKVAPAMLGDARILFDLSGVKRAGERTFPVDRANIVLPAGVDLDRAWPAQVRLQFEPRMSKRVPVRLRVGHKPADGYEIAVREISPGQIQITGPESRVSRIESVETDSIDVDHLKDAAEEFRVYAYLADPQVRFEGDGRVKVRIEIRKTARPTH